MARDGKFIGATSFMALTTAEVMMAQGLGGEVDPAKREKNNSGGGVVFYRQMTAQIQ